jgi:hypothetical protein
MPLLSFLDTEKEDHGGQSFHTWSRNNKTLRSLDKRGEKKRQRHQGSDGQETRLEQWCTGQCFNNYSIC